MLLVYLPTVTPRSEYIFEFIFKNEFGINYKTTTDRSAFENYTGEKMNYSGQRFHDEFFIKAAGLLEDDGLKKIDISVAEKHQTKVLFPNEGCDVGFDIFSATFYMVSRYEEYLPFNPDQFGRFKATESLAYQNNFLSTPVVDIWIGYLKKILLQKFSSLKIKPAVFNAILTYDIDVAYKFRGRSFIRNTGSILKDLSKFDFKNILERFQTFLNIKKDPWDVYDYLSAAIEKRKLKSVFFFLLGDKSKYDRNLNYKNPWMKKVIKKITEFSEAGIHPSFVSNAFSKKFLIEKERLEKISQKKITKSRQHFLKFKLPDTYLNLISAGITEDYSIGFPEMTGFRAGTCKPFYFYDLKNEQSTNLKLFPATCMEVTFMDYLQMSPEEALQNMYQLMQEVMKVDGTFISIWHNNTIIETASAKNWYWAHEQMLSELERLIQIQN
jgi:hypothetical protein